MNRKIFTVMVFALCLTPMAVSVSLGDLTICREKALSGDCSESPPTGWPAVYNNNGQWTACDQVTATGMGAAAQERRHNCAAAVLIIKKNGTWTCTTGAATEGCAQAKKANGDPDTIKCLEKIRCRWDTDAGDCFTIEPSEFSYAQYRTTVTLEGCPGGQD